MEYEEKIWNKRKCKRVSAEEKKSGRKGETRKKVSSKRARGKKEKKPKERGGIEREGQGKIRKEKQERKGGKESFGED